MKKRVVVYGNASSEKEKYVNVLQTSSSRNFSFESSTPENRFRSIDSGFSTPLYTAPWQLLVVNMEQLRFDTTPPKFEALFPQCDLNRPLIVLFYGVSDPKTDELVEAFNKGLAKHNVKTIRTTELENVSLDDLICEFYDLEKENVSTLEQKNLSI
jgi:hypothetical protein